MPVVTLDGFPGCLHVIFFRFEDETDFVEGRGRGKVIHQFQVQRDVFVFRCFVCRAGRHETLQGCIIHPAIVNEDEIRVASGDDSRGLLLPRRRDDFDIEFLGNAFLELDVDAVLRDKALAGLQCFGRQVAQHFKLIFALADQGAQRDCDGQAGHAGAGDAHAHGIFQDIGAQQRLDLIGPAAQLFGGFCRTQRHRHGLGATDGGDDFLVYQRDDSCAGFFVYHTV